MNFITVDKVGGNTFLSIIFGIFLLIWIIRVKSTKITFMLHYYGEYSMAINSIYKGSHFSEANISAWDKENLGIIQLATSWIGSYKSVWTWHSVPRFFKDFILPAMHFFMQSLLLWNTLKFKRLSLRFLGHSHQMYGKIRKEEFVPVFFPL